MAATGLKTVSCRRCGHPSEDHVAQGYYDAVRWCRRCDCRNFT